MPDGGVEAAGAYRALVPGSAVYDGSWVAELDAFVRRERDALATRPVWLFSVGSFSDRKRVLGPLIKREPKGIGEGMQAIGPRDYRVFAGVIRAEQWPWWGRVLLRAFGGRLGDSRDRDDIEAWARQTAAALSDQSS